MSRRSIARDDRAATSPVSNVLTIGITTVLILGLIIGATGLLAGQQERTARSELRAVGESLAVELEQVASLARSGGTPNVTTQHAGRVVGDQYTVELLSGSPCDTYRTPSDTCLRLRSQDPDVTQYVPVNNDSSVNIYLASQGQGEFALSARADGTSAVRSTAISDTDLSSRIGVGRDIATRGILLDNPVGNTPPVARFSYTPVSPQNGDSVTFNATESYDPDGTIQEYQWDFNDDGTYEETTTSPTITHSFSSGSYNVSLRVVDDSNVNNSRTRLVDVSGLVLDSTIDTSGGGPQTVTFDVKNTFSQEMTITSVLVDPDKGNRDDLEEIVIGGRSVASGGEIPTIYDGGTIIFVSPVTVASGDTVTIGLDFQRGFPNKELRIGVGYKVGGIFNSTSFDGCAGPPGQPNSGSCGGNGNPGNGNPGNGNPNNAVEAPDRS